jgi:hypothetical protein
LRFDTIVGAWDKIPMTRSELARAPKHREVCRVLTRSALLYMLLHSGAQSDMGIVLCTAHIYSKLPLWDAPRVIWSKVLAAESTRFHNVHA